MFRRFKRRNEGVQIDVTVHPSETVATEIEIDRPEPRKPIIERIKLASQQKWQQLVDSYDTWIEQSAAFQAQWAENQKKEFLNRICYVYLMLESSKGYYKIGISKDPERRRAQLANSSPHKVTLLHTITCEDRESSRELELKLHDKFSHRLVSNEWFQLNLIDVAYICRLGDYGTESFREKIAEIRDQPD